MEDERYRSAYYDDYVSGHQGEIEEALSEANLDADVVSRLPAGARQAILDVGCGQGQLVEMLLRRGYRDVVGVDTSPEQVALARRRGRPVELGSLFDIAKARPDTYDIVTAIDVVEHFEPKEAEAVFRGFAKLLKPGGMFVLRTPNGSSPYSGRFRYGDMTHGMVYTRTSLEQVAHLTGFVDMKVYPVRPAGTTPRRRVRRVAWTLIEALIKVPLIVETGVTQGHVVTQNLVGVATKSDEPLEHRNLLETEL